MKQGPGFGAHSPPSGVDDESAPDDTPSGPVTATRRSLRLVFFVVALVVLLLLPSPWNVIACVASLAAALGEVTYWQRRVRGREVSAGAETLIGSRGTVVQPLRPAGQVRVAGELWEATSERGADPGEAVTVVGRDGLTLLVEPDAPATG